jgi:hypothetical protein
MEGGKLRAHLSHDHFLMSRIMSQGSGMAPDSSPIPHPHVAEVSANKNTFIGKEKT